MMMRCPSSALPTIRCLHSANRTTDTDIEVLHPEPLLEPQLEPLLEPQLDGIHNEHDNLRIELEFKPQRGMEQADNRSPNKNRNKRGALGSGGDQLCEMRMFIPDDEDGAAYQEFNDTLKKKAKLKDDENDLIAWFKNIVFRVPRGNLVSSLDHRL